MAPTKFTSRMEDAYKEKVVNYELPTRIGYWIDKLEFIRGKMEIVKNKRAKCEALFIRKKLLSDNILKPTLLQPPKPFISYGDALQITTDEVQCEEYGIKPHVIGAIVTESDIDKILNLCHGCPVFASTERVPYVRNVFTILDPKEGRTNQVVKYGKDVYISLSESGADRILYLQAQVSTYDNFGGSNEHYPLRLSECADRYCKFKILHHDLDKRDLTFGEPVPSNERICIAHVLTNRFLVTERTYIPSLFGTEMNVSCYVYQRLGRQEPCNFWQLTIQKRKSLKEKLDNED